MTDTENVVVWPRWCYTNNHMDTEAQDLVLNNNNSSFNNNNTSSISISLKHRESSETTKNRKRSRRDLNGVSREVQNGMPNESSTGDVKSERVSPDPSSPVAPSTTQPSHTSPSPANSPKSPNSSRTRTPSFPGTPPNPTFTPPTTSTHTPYDRISPAALTAMGGLPGGHGALKQMESLMVRNCSDMMRSLAAKYKYNAPNDYFSSPSNNFLPAPLNNMNQFKQNNPAFMGATTPSTTQARDVDKKPEVHSTVAPSIPGNLPPPGAPPIFGGAGIPGFAGFPLVDMSSTQVLLNMVRNASAAQQTHLESYLNRGSIKRPADGPVSPLDLSSSVGAKRPRTDMGKGFDMKNLFGMQPHDEKEGKNSPNSLLKTRPISSPIAPKSTLSSQLCNDQNCHVMENIAQWTVEDVCLFVGSIDLCAEYVEAFRDQRIDGSALALLTEEHLTTSICMKLGPALKLRAVLAKRMGACNICLHCTHCHSPPSDRRPSSASGQ